MSPPPLKASLKGAQCLAHRKCLSIFVEDRHGSVPGAGVETGAGSVGLGHRAEHQGGNRLQVASMHLWLYLHWPRLSGRSLSASKLIHGPGSPVLPEQLSVNNYFLQGPSIRFRGWRLIFKEEFSARALPEGPLT